MYMQRNETKLFKNAFYTKNLQKETFRIIVTIFSVAQP